MNILFISYYFPPDLCAGSFRAEALVKAIQNECEEANITVVTTEPNRYGKYIPEIPVFNESIGRPKVIRVKVFNHNNSPMWQLLSFVKFGFFVILFSSKKHYDIVFCTSARLMSGWLGAFVANKLHIPYYLDVRDLFGKTLSDKYKNNILKKFTDYIERRQYSIAEKINIVSLDYEKYINKKVSNKRFSNFSNGIDDIFLDYDFKSGVKKTSDKRPVILYAGNIGEGQALDKIIPLAAAALKNEYKFKVIGDGGLSSKLRSELKRLQVKNVEVIDPTTRELLRSHYSDADILFLHINDYPGFDDVLPSKMYEYGATGKYILAGVSGSAKRFLEGELGEGVFVFPPCDVNRMVSHLKELNLSNLKNYDRVAFCRNHSRKTISKNMAIDIISIIK